MPRTTTRPATPPRPTSIHDTAPAELELIDDQLLAWNATDASRAVARYNLATFARWLAANDTTLLEATPAHCKAWLTAREDEVAASTVVKCWSHLRAFYACCEADTLTDPLDGRRSPMARIPMPRAPKWARTHAATPAEVDAVIATFDLRSGVGLRNAAMVSLMFRSGLRVSEAAAANLADVDLEARTIHLPTTKNREPRTAALHPETINLLARYLHPRRRGDGPGPLFVNVGNRAASERLPVGAAQTVVKRAAARAGVAVTPHSLRRGFVVQYLTHGGGAASLMVTGGWQDETMIVRYMGDQRAATAQAVFDEVAARQVAARNHSDRRRRLRAVN